MNNAKCPYCGKELDVIDVAIANIEAFARPGDGYSQNTDAMTKCCGKIIRISGRAYVKFSIHPYSEDNMPTEDDFGNEIGKPIVRD